MVLQAIAFKFKLSVHLHVRRSSVDAMSSHDDHYHLSRVVIMISAPMARHADSERRTLLRTLRCDLGTSSIARALRQPDVVDMIEKYAEGDWFRGDGRSSIKSSESTVLDDWIRACLAAADASV
jgi:hypothetical protein